MNSYRNRVATGSYIGNLLGTEWLVPTLMKAIQFFFFFYTFWK